MHSHSLQILDSLDNHFPLNHNPFTLNNDEVLKTTVKNTEKGVEEEVEVTAMEEETREGEVIMDMRVVTKDMMTKAKTKDITAAVGEVMATMMAVMVAERAEEEEETTAMVDMVGVATEEVDMAKGVDMAAMRNTVGADMAKGVEVDMVMARAEEEEVTEKEVVMVAALVMKTMGTEEVAILDTVVTTDMVEKVEVDTAEDTTTNSFYQLLSQPFFSLKQRLDVFIPGEHLNYSLKFNSLWNLNLIRPPLTLHPC